MSKYIYYLDILNMTTDYIIINTECCTKKVARQMCECWNKEVSKYA